MKFIILKIVVVAICFSFLLANCIPTFALENTLSGIDVSDYQGTIDFGKVKDDGIEVVIIRAAYGRDYQDITWQNNYKNAFANGLTIGFYQYVTASTIDEAKTQARFFYDLVKDKSYDFGLVMDFEPDEDLREEVVNEVATAYLEELEMISGKKPIIYSDVNRIDTVWDSNLSKYPLWVAEYGVDEPSNIGAWSEWIGFQYSDVGKINGINGDVDLDFFKSSFINNDDTTKPSTYTVKSGDTLSEIALRFNTTVSILVKLNNIENPDLIFPNQVIILPTSTTENKTYIVKPGDTLWDIALKFDTTVNSLVELNNIKNPDLIFPNQVLFIP